MSEEDLKKKFEKYQEDMLKNAAITFSMEGLSKDIKFFLQKKMSYNLDCQKNIVELVKAVSSCEDTKVRSSLLNEGSIVRSMLMYSYGETRLVDMMLNMIIQKIFEKEVSLSIEEDIPSKASSPQTKCNVPHKNTTKPLKE